MFLIKERGIEKHDILQNVMFAKDNFIWCGSLCAHSQKESCTQNWNLLIAEYDVTNSFSVELQPPLVFQQLFHAQPGIVFAQPRQLVFCYVKTQDNLIVIMSNQNHKIHQATLIKTMNVNQLIQSV